MTSEKKPAEDEREEGEIKILPSGDVIIGAPTAAAFGKAPLPFGDDDEEEDED